MAASLTYWLDAVAVHQLRENTHTRYTACANRYLVPTLQTPHRQRSPPAPHRRARTQAPCLVRTHAPHRTLQRQTPRPPLGRPRPRRRHRHHPPLSLQRTRSQGLTVLHIKILASERRIALPTECISSLKIHQEQQQEERQEAGTGWTDNGFVFTTPKGSPLDPTNLTRRFRRLLHCAGLRTIRFHDLRHSTATLLLEQGVGLVVIKELLGPAHIGVTAGVYAHVRLRLQRQAIDTLGNALNPTDTPDDPPAAAVVR